MDKLKMPVFSSAPITQRFGENPLDYRAFGLVGHNGVDWGVPEGTPVRAAAGGEVARACMDDSGYGLHVRLQSAGCLTLYAHLSRLAVKQGQVVTAGELLGYSGNTGNTTGPHLHFEVRAPGGPAGYGGAVDPLPLLAAAQEVPGDLPAAEKVLFRGRVVAAAGVNVRSLPGMSGVVLGAKPYGAAFDVYEVRGDWARSVGGWSCMQLGEEALIVRLDQSPDWYQALDTWARGLGFTGPAAPKGK